MIYKCSSFLKWLKEGKDCEIIPMQNNSRLGVILIKNGVMKYYLMTNKKDRIDYEEIYNACQRLYIVGLPGDSDLERIE